MKSTYTSRALSFTVEKRALFGVCIVLTLLALFYVYYVMLSIAHVVEREELVVRSQQLSEKVANLEQGYLTASNAVTETVAYNEGYVPTKHRTYVERGTLTLGNAR